MKLDTRMRGELREGIMEWVFPDADLKRLADELIGKLMKEDSTLVEKLGLGKLNPDKAVTWFLLGDTRVEMTRLIYGTYEVAVDYNEDTKNLNDYIKLRGSFEEALTALVDYAKTTKELAGYFTNAGVRSWILNYEPMRTERELVNSVMKSIRGGV